MTTTPAMPELLREIVAYCREAGHDWSSLAEAEHMLATLQSQPAEVSDAELRKTIDALRDPGTVSAFYNGYYTLTPDELRRAILALRQQSEPAQPRTFDDRNAKFREENWQIRFDAAVEARRAAQEQLYTERERHTAEVKRLQAEIGRLKSERPQAVPMTRDVFGALKKVHETAVYLGAGECSITMDLVREIDAIFERSTAHHGITAPAGGEG